RRARETGRVALDQQQRDPAHAGPAGAHGDGVVVGAHARGDEGLLAAHDEMLAVAACGGLEVGNVGARAGLGDGERRDLLARQDRRQDAGFHFCRAEAGDRRRADGVTVEGGGDAATARARQLLGVDDAIEAVAGDAAVLLRKAQLQEADGGGLLVKLARKLPRLVPLGGVGLDLARNEPAHRLAEGCVLRCVVGGAALKGDVVLHGSHPAGFSSTSSWRVATWSPGLTARRATRPAAGAVISCCIFMASTTTRRWPLSTASPSATSTATTLPFMGARSSVSDPLAIPAEAGGA